MVNVELIYLAADKSVFYKELQLQLGATVADALTESGIFELYPETRDFAVGIFAKPVSGKTPLKTGDRIEIYRPLIIDPKEKRRQRAKK